MGQTSMNRQYRRGRRGTAWFSRHLFETVLAVALLPLTLPAVIAVMGTRGGGR